MITIDEYLANVPLPQRKELMHIRSLVKQLVPEAEEAISYGMPAFKYNNQPLLYIAAFKDHMSIFPTGDPLSAIQDELKPFRTSKGTLQFTENAPIPDTLIKEIIKLRLKNIDT